MASPWTPALIAEIRKLRAKGMTPTDIGLVVGLNKSQVAGKLRDLGLAKPRVFSDPARVVKSVVVPGYREPLPAGHPISAGVLGMVPWFVGEFHV